MPQVSYSPNAMRDLQRLRDFLRPKNPMAAAKAGATIRQSIQILRLQPGIGRPVEDLPAQFRELVIEFGGSGYVARYRFDPDADSVAILAIRHQKEVGFLPTIG